MAAVEIILASSSPRRAALLRALGISATVLPPSVDESLRSGEEPLPHAARLAAEKAEAVVRRLPRRAGVVLAADTIVVAGGVMGKPTDASDARSMLRHLSGREHEVLTAVHLIRADTGATAALIESTRVCFRACDDRWIEWYVATKEPFGKAGAYSIQGLGALLAERIEGSWSNVVGLPVERLPELFAHVGVDFLGLLEQSSPRADVDLGVSSRGEEGPHGVTT